ncbi:MAG: YcfL family protein [Gallionella sp.]|nr:YcfL family protein [Gallionella sp.]MDD4946224.1 YcfL family protein [Gallionella sp.]MDD5612523.1 YcfL family protein [Gallionella sp.]
MKSLLLAATLGCMTCLAHAAQPANPTPPAVAAKVALRGEPYGVRVAEMRIVRKNDILTVQADLENTVRANRTVFYRFRWLDDMGNQVGDGESWKQMGLYGLQLQTVKSVAPNSSATDLKLEMNVEQK